MVQGVETSVWKTRYYLSDIANIIANDDLETHGARASAFIWSTWFTQNIMVSAPGGLNLPKKIVDPFDAENQ